MLKFNVFVKPFHNSDFKITLLVLYFKKKLIKKKSKNLFCVMGHKYRNIIKY